MEAAPIVTRMLKNDAFSQWLGISILHVGEGTATIEMTPTNAMCNGFGVVHGGILYAFADSALAFASNSTGQHAMSIEGSISHLIPVRPGDVIRAEATTIRQGNTIAVFHVALKNATGQLVADFKGTVIRKVTTWNEIG